MGGEKDEGLKSELAVLELPATPSSWKVEAAGLSVHALKAELEARLGITNRTTQPWTIFTPSGEEITTVEQLLAEPVALVYEGGRFIWPGVRVGHETAVSLDGGAKMAKMVTLSMQPLVFEIEDFLTIDECDYIQEFSR